MLSVLTFILNGKYFLYIQKDRQEPRLIGAFTLSAVKKRQQAVRMIFTILDAAGFPGVTTKHMTHKEFLDLYNSSTKDQS